MVKADKNDELGLAAYCIKQSLAVQEGLGSIPAISGFFVLSGRNKMEPDMKNGISSVSK